MRLLSQIRFWLHRSRRKMATGAIGVLILMLAYHVVFGANGALVYAGKRAEYQKLDQEMQQLQLDNERLNQNIHRLKTDPQTIEKEAREQLKYTRPGEIVFTLPEDQKAQTATAQDQTKKPQR